MKKKPKPAAEISQDDVTPPAGTLLEGTEPELDAGDENEQVAAEKPTGWDANGSEVTTATVGVLAALPAEHPAPVDLLDAPPAPAALALSEEERAQIATYGHVLGREQ